MCLHAAYQPEKSPKKFENHGPSPARARPEPKPDPKSPARVQLWRVQGAIFPSPKSIVDCMLVVTNYREGVASFNFTMQRIRNKKEQSQ